MTADIIKFEDSARTYERDKRVMEARLKGVSLREIADDEGCSDDEIEASIIRMSGGVSPNFRERQMQLLLQRNDKLLAGHYDKAIGGNYDSSVIYLRTIEMTARLLGLFPPPADASLEKLRPRSTSTAEIRAVLDNLLGRTDRTIDGEVVCKEGDDGGNG